MTDQLLQLIATQAWQIAALAIGVAIVNRTVAKNRPHLAHALWMLVLIKCVTPPIWGHSLGLFSQLQALWKAGPVVQQELASDEQLLMPHHNTDDEISLAPPADVSPLPGLIAMKDSDVASTSNVPITLPTETAASSFIPEATPWKPSWPMILLSLVAVGAVLTISIMVARCTLCLRHIQRHRTKELDESLNEQLQRLSRQLRVRRVPRIIVSDVLFGPAVIGLWRHVIVLPRCLIKSSRSCLPGRTFAARRTVVPPQTEQRQGEESSANVAADPSVRGCTQVAASREVLPGREDLQELLPVDQDLSFLDPILAHELLHIRRGDLRTGTLQAIVQSLWWFHPAVWLCNRWLSREAERCCDEQVIAELGCSPAQYARSLLSVIESKHALQPIPVFPGMKPVEITSQRMERIMSLKSNLKKQTPFWCWLAIGVLAVVVLPGAVATIEADELKNSQTGTRASASTAPSSQEQPNNFDHQHKPKKADKLIPHFLELFTFPVSLNLKDRSLFSIIEMLAEEHHFLTSWKILSDQKLLFRSIDYSCHQLPLRIALEQIVEKAGCRLTIDQYTVEIQRLEVNPPSTMKLMDAHASERSPQWALKQIRWNDALMVSPNQIPNGETVIAWVNDVPVRVSDVVSIERQTPGRFIIRALNERVGRYLAQEIVIQHSTLTAGDRFAIEMASNAEQETRLNGEESESWLAQWAFSPEAARAYYVRERMMRHLHLVYHGMMPHIVQAAIDAAQGRILDAQLRTPVSYALEGTDLANAVVMVGREFAIDISVSPLHVEMATRAVNSHVTIDFRNRPLADLIREIIEPYGMETEITQGRIQIALSKTAEEQFYSSTPPAFAVFGSVKGTGWTDLTTDVRLLEAIRKAGLDDELQIVDVTHSRMQSADGRPKHTTVSLSQLEADESGELNCLLQDGDIITIQRDPNLRIADQSVNNAPVTPAKTSVGTASKAVGDTFEESTLPKLVTETREQVSRRLLSTDQHTPWQIMSGIEGLRGDMVLKNGETTVNALEWIQAGPMYQGESWFEKTKHGGRAHPYSKPYWFEGHVNQFLSKLAACRLPLDATFGTPDGPITTQDMINHAKMVVNDKEEVSWTLLALCRYLPLDAKWTNAKGEEWSLERLVDIEVGKPVGGPTSPNGGTDGLYALSVARNEYLLTGKPLEGVWLKADEKIRKYIDLARSQQNPDGTLSSDFFRSSKRKEQFDRRLSSTGHLLQFLMHAVSDEQLKEDWIRRAVETTAYDIQVHRNEFVACDPLFTATAALTTYLERTQGISLGLVASPLPMNVASGETSAIETGASSNDQPSQLSKVLIGPAPKQNENAATLQKSPVPLTLITYYVGDLVTRPVGSVDKKPDFASVVELIKATIEPDSWHDGATIEVVRDNLSLVVRQSPQIHDRIETLLREVRRDTRQIQISCRLMKLTTDEQLKGVQERCSMHPLNDHKSWALLTKSRSDEVIRSLNNKHTDVLMDPIITTYSGMTATIQLDPEETGDSWLRSLGFGSGTTTTLFRGCALGVEPRIIGDSSVIRLKHSVYLNLMSAAENHSGSLTGNEGTSPLCVDESLVSSGQTLLLLIDTNKVNTEVAALDSTSDQQNSARGRYVVMLTVERLEEEVEPGIRSQSK